MRRIVGLLTAVGLVLGLVALLVWRRMERKEPIRVSGKTVLTVFVGVVGALALGIGMCFTMVWGRLVTGIVVGIAGIVILLNKKAADGFGLTCGFFVIAIICCFAVTFVLSTSDKINAYYGKKEIMYD